MKNVAHHTKQLKTVGGKLAKEFAAAERPKLDPLRAMVVGGLSCDAPDAAVQKALAVIDAEFVDVNELRVATELELQQLLGTDFPDIDSKSRLLKEMLNAIFEKEQTLSLDRLADIKKTDARQFLKDLPGMTPYVEAYVMLHAFEAGVVPVDETTLAFLQDKDMVEAESDTADAQAFLERQLKVDEAWPFFAALRAAAFTGGYKPKKISKKTTKAKKK
ncbi:MAG: hypothetical protein ACFCVE_10940 [Phycisphaerae bacterium]